MQAFLKLVVVVAALCNSARAAVAPETCILCGANECPPTKGDAVTLTCDKDWSLANGQCPKVLRDSCMFSKTCIDQIPQHYSVMMYDASRDGFIQGFAFRKTGGIDMIQRELVTFTVQSEDGKYQQAFRYISGSQGCDAAFIRPAKVLSVTAQPIVGN